MEKETSKIDPKIQQEADRAYELIKACNNSDKPDPKARKELQNLIENSLVAKALIEKQEGLYSLAQRNRIDSFNASDTFYEIVRAKCRLLREQLGYATANKLEKLAIEQIVLCWLNYYQTEMSHANVFTQSINRESGMYWEKRLDMASRRYQRALETLSKMRKMNLTLQFNSAQNQIVNNG